MRDPVGLLLWVCATAIAGATALALGDRVHIDAWPGWVFDLLSHWPKHLAVAGIIVGALAAWRRSPLPAGIALSAGALNLAIVIGMGGFALPQTPPVDARLLRVVSANVHGSMPALEALAERARAYGADIVSIYETPDELHERDLERLFPQLADRSLPSVRPERPKWKRRRRSLLAARDVGPIDVTGFMGSHGVVIRAHVGDLQIVTTHPPSPGGSGERWDRDRQLASLRDGLDTKAPFIIMGDFNSTPWGHAYDSVPGTRAGDPRFEGTFPAFAGMLGLPIDHIRFGGRLVLTDYRTGPDIGSDHLPLFATFALPAK